MAASRSVTLNPREQQLRALLLDVAASIDASGSVHEPIILRWAGGWVRDKLLGVESHDIDVAINAMTGVAFAQRICDYCDTPAAVKKHSIGPDDIGNLHNVARNPDKSKHLETAMVRMLGLDLDFVNLRKETYAEDSRNPQMEFGTAEEDALRRDATINALFYNLNTDQVEDFTGGLADMDKKIIRTPLEPLQTFTDDPLRVLRLVRFASRLQFSIDSDTERFMGDKRVLDSLTVKISRERVGVELEKMLKGTLITFPAVSDFLRGDSEFILLLIIRPGKFPCSSLEIIDRLGLYRAIFTNPARADSTPSYESVLRWSVAYKCLHELMQNRTSPGSIAHTLVRTDDAAYVAWNLAAVAPWLPVMDPPDPHRKPNALPPVAVIAREGFKSPNKLTDVIAASHRNREEILALKQAVCNKESFLRERDRFGMAIRRWEFQGGSWRLQVLSTLLVEAMEHFEKWSGPEMTARIDFLQGWQDFLDHLTELDVYEAPSLKRLLDGNALAKSLGTKPGKWTGKALEVCVAWQLRNPKQTDPTGAVEEVQPETQSLTAEVALACLCIILADQPASAQFCLSDAALLSIITYANATDAWATRKAASLATQLLDSQLLGDKLTQFIVGPLLRDYFRPLFSKSSARVTSSGRPSYYAEATHDSPPGIETPSWKNGGDGSIVLSRFRWAVMSSDEELIATHWPLFTPPLLTLIEDDQTLTRKQGLNIMTNFLGKCPGRILVSTGVRNVIEDAIFPTLMFLPTLTPEAESIELLHAAYGALFLLIKGEPGGVVLPDQRSSLDKLFRDGIVAAFYHASQYARITELLMKYTTRVVQELGLSATKHLQTLVSMVTSILQDPFALAYPPGVLAAIETLHAVILNCWPRVSTPAHAGQIVKSLTICWLNIRDKDLEPQGLGDDLTCVEQQLKLAATCLQACWLEFHSSPPQDMSEVIKREPSVALLFPAFPDESTVND
ncbi:Nucleotidyltransferase lcsQ [Paramyrothecium foliicola]|nr:Nucleotidyltransferase lcsQ [Paramyrothecium foliicola]